MAPLNACFLLLASCITSAVPASSFLLPSSLTAATRTTTKTNELKSSPNSPGDWFSDDRANMYGRQGVSIEPLNEDFIGNTGTTTAYSSGTAGMNKAGILQQQRKPTTVRFEGTRGKQPAQTQRSPQSYYPQKPVTPTRESPSSSWGTRDVRRPNLEFQQGSQEPAMMSAYEQWKQGDDRPTRAGASIASTKTRRPQYPSSQKQKASQELQMPRYKQQQQQQRARSATGRSMNTPRPDTPSAWFQSDESQTVVGGEAPFEGRLNRPFRSTPDQPGDWFQTAGVSADGPPVVGRERQPQRPQQREKVTSQQQTRRQEVRRPVMPNTPNQSSPRKSNNYPGPEAASARREEPRRQEVRKPNLPQRPNSPSMARERAQPLQERKPKIPTMSSNSATGTKRQLEYAPKGMMSSNVQAPPMQRRQPPPPMREQAPFREPGPFIHDNFPQAPSPTGSIMPLAPLAGGPLGPVSFSFDSPVLTGAGNGGQRIYDQFRAPEEVIHGAGSRKTWETSHHDKTIMEVGSQGRPVMATAQVWQGPGNTPASMTMYSEDGGMRPWKAAFQNTNRSGGNSVLDVRNDGPMAFPADVSVVGKHDNTKGVGKMEKDAVEYHYEGPSKYKITQTVQGQSLKYFNIKRGVGAVMIELFSEGRPMFVQVELWQGPNAVKQCAEIYSDNGNDRHWSAQIDTHGQECVIAVRNVGPALVYPIKASVDPILM